MLAWHLQLRAVPNVTASVLRGTKRNRKEGGLETALKEGGGSKGHETAGEAHHDVKARF